MSDRRGFKWLGVLPLLLGAAGCGSTPPADQFKPIADAKKTQLTRFLDSKQSRLVNFNATVTEEPNIEKRRDHTHIGLIEFEYPVTELEGESELQILNTAVGEYHFSRKETKWIFKECFLKQGGGGLSSLEPETGLLVPFPEVKAAFEK